tara:strand:- start:74 stop:901 length:828 start_codon:yes stop_codon:yes gene_type:complete
MGVQTALAVGGMLTANRNASKSRGMASRAQAEALAFQKEQSALLETQKEAYRNIQFTDPYAGTTNPFAGMQTRFDNLAENVVNPFAGMENRMEDLTVDTRAAEFQAQQGAQQRANILQGLRGAAGASGVAGLAQALSQQGQLQAQQIAATIGQQERQNRLLAAQEGARIDQLTRQGEAQRQAQILAGASQARQLGVQREQVVAQGAFQADQIRRAGQAALQEAEMSRQSTLLGIQFQMSAGANEALQGAQTNMMNASLAGAQMQQDAFTTLVGTL